MKRIETYWILGLLLVAAGLLLLLQNLGLLRAAVGLAWGGIFAASGVLLLTVFATNNVRNWWAAIPGCGLLGLAALVALEGIGLGDLGAWGGALFLGGFAAGFWLVYLSQPAGWWAIIPGGVLFSLGATVAVSAAGANRESGAVFLLGMAATFLLVYLLVPPRGRAIWALVPAGVFFLLSLTASVSLAPLAGYMWGLVLIGAGVCLVFRTYRAAHR